MFLRGDTGVTLLRGRAGRAARNLPVARVLTVLLLLFGFLVGVKGLRDGFEQLCDGALEVIFAATQNPFIGLIVGVLATTVVQSSSVTTAMIVGLVAAPESPLSLANAVPMVMGANIGTTVMATFVSLAHMGRRDEFERAFPVAVCHDLFNHVTVLALLPLKLMTGYLQQTAVAVVWILQDVRGFDYASPLSEALMAALAPIEQFLAWLLPLPALQGGCISPDCWDTHLQYALFACYRSCGHWCTRVSSVR